MCERGWVSRGIALSGLDEKAWHRGVEALGRSTCIHTLPKRALSEPDNTTEDHRDRDEAARLGAGVKLAIR